MDNTDALLARKFQLQRQVLDSWSRFNNAQVAHNRLLAELNAVRKQLAGLSDLISELFGELDNHCHP